MVTVVAGWRARAVLAVPAGPAPGVGRQQAQRLARSELSRPAYHQHPPWPQLVLDDVLRWLGSVYRAAGGVPGGWWAVVALTALAVLLTAGVLAWIGPVARPGRAPAPLIPAGAPRTARDHRENAQRLADSADYGAAVCECLRAIAADLEERGVLPPRAGRTADEFAEEAGQALPAHTAALRAASRRFDEIRYGKRAGSLVDYEGLRELDLQTRRSPSRPRGPDTVPVPAGWRTP